jgi:hypothetical protein
VSNGSALVSVSQRKIGSGPAFASRSFESGKSDQLIFLYLKNSLAGATYQANSPATI